MQGSDFIFCLQDADFNFWKIDSMGNVVKSSDPYFLDFSPAGWEDISIQNKTNENYWSVDRTVTLPLSYVNDGGKIIKYVLYTLGTEEPLYLVIASQRLDYSPTPVISGAIASLTGSLPFTVGTNTGTVSGTPGSTVYVKVTLGGTTPGNITGNIGGGVFVNINAPAAPQIFAVVIPTGGSVSYNFAYTRTGGTSADFGTADITSATGATTATYGYWYKRIFRGQVDLSAFIHNGSKVTCSTLEDGLAKYLKSNENTVYELPMNVPEAIFIEANGIILHNLVNNFVSNGFSSDSNYDRGNHTVPLTITSEDAAYVGGKKDVGRIKYGVDNATLVATGQWFLASSVSGNATFDYDFSFVMNFPSSSVSLNPAASWRVQIIQFNAAGAQLNAVTLFNSGTSDPNRFSNRTYHVAGSTTLTLVPGAFVYFNAFCNVSGANGADSIQVDYIDNGANFFKYAYLYRYPKTYVRALRLQYVMEQLVNKFTELKYTAALSAYLDANKEVVLTSGNAIRGFDDATLKIDFSDFYAFLNCFDAVGIYEKNKQVFIDRKENMVDRSNPINLGAPALKTFKVSIRKNLLFNELEIGYPKISNEVGLLNGNEEPNNSFLFSAGTAVSPKRLSKISPIKASPYEFERIRALSITSASTDYKSDNDNFAVHIESTQQPAAGIIPAYYRFDRSLNAGATGLIETASIFNLYLTPHRNLNRMGSYLRSCFYIGDNRVLSFKSSDKNAELACGGVIEKADVPIGSLPPRFFYPLLFEFNIDAPMELEELLEADPLALFILPLDGEIYSGTLQAVGVSPSKNAPQKFQLMCDITCDPTKLIEYYG